MTAPQPGDRVRVTFEAIYKRAPGNMSGGHAVGVNLPGYEDYWSAVPPDAVIEVLAKPLQVGDIVEGAEAYAALPVGTLLAGDAAFYACPLLRTRNGMVDTDGEFWELGQAYSPRVIAYLPKATP